MDMEQIQGKVDKESGRSQVLASDFEMAVGDAIRLRRNTNIMYIYIYILFVYMYIYIYII